MGILQFLYYLANVDLHETRVHAICSPSHAQEISAVNEHHISVKFKFNRGPEVAYEQGGLESYLTQKTKIQARFKRVLFILEILSKYFRDIYQIFWVFWQYCENIPLRHFVKECTTNQKT